MSSIFSVTGLYYTAVALVVAVALAFSVNAFASSQPKENLEAVLQVHAEVAGFQSMTDLDKYIKSSNNGDINIAINNCKEIRGEDPQCEVTGTEPVVAGIEYSFARNGGAFIPKGMDLKKGDLVTEESYPTELNKPPILVQKHEKGDCEWTHPFKLAGSGRVECKDDEANGFEEFDILIKKIPTQTFTRIKQPHMKMAHH